MRKIATLLLLVLLKSSPVAASEATSLHPPVGLKQSMLNFLPDTSILATMGKALDMVTEKYNEGIEWLSPLAFKYALKLDLPVEELGNTRLLSFIEDWYGVKYRFGGDSKSGIDCSAFTRKLMGEVFSVSVGRVVPDQLKAGIEIPKSELRMGDLIFFQTNTGHRKGLTHVGFYIGNGNFVHASSKKGVVFDNIDHDYYKKAFRKAVRPHAAPSILPMGE
jgi:lipoprotein Spr